ncbi:MAG: transposase [Planctomycetota bacterium]|jgi:hypothetical protein
MHNIVNPQQTRLFDPFDSVLTEQTRTRLLNGWHGVFRHVILELMPVDAVSGHFDATMGRPTKELYSIAGLLLIREFKNWTKDEALEAYSLDMNIHYALNLEPVAHDLGMRTLERYIALFEEDRLAKATLNDITLKLVDLLDIKIDKQRLDSTHIFSDMASFGRTRLMGVAIKRFLTQLVRHNKEAYHSLDESFRHRYAPSVHQLFADTQKDSQSRKHLRQQVAEDMHFIVRHFGNDAEHRDKDTYKAVERIFYEQCEVHEETVIVKKKTGGDVMQNPSDPDATYDGHKGPGYQAQIADATYDGHKGPGYQAQIAETCHPENEIQLITSAIAQTAAQSDANAVEEVLDDLSANGLLPDEMLADTLYAGDDNVQLAKEQGVELLGPVAGCSSQDDSGPVAGCSSQDDSQLTIDDFNVDETTEEVVCCPAGHKPERSEHNGDTGKTKTMMPESSCGHCEFYQQCPVTKSRDGYRLEHTAKDRRLRF